MWQFGTITLMIEDFRGGPRSPKERNERDDFLLDLSQPSNQTMNQKPDEFLTPDQIANRDRQANMSRPVNNVINPTTGQAQPNNLYVPGKKQRSHKLTRWFGRLKLWQQALFGVVLILMLVGGGAAVYALFGGSPAETSKKAEPKKTTVVVAKPTTVASTLTGRQVAPEINQRQVTGVMIENSQDARPQGGLQQAGVVFEAIAEGGITRFLALFQDTDAESIGPVRSVRPYYISWARGFDAAIAHVGGSPEALQIMRTQGLKDLDQSFNPSFFQRVTFRYAPHNVFTSTTQLRQLQDSKGYTNSAYTGFARNKTAGKPVSPVTAGNISVNISSRNYASSYVYNPTTNTYARNLAGAPHTDITTKTQITPDVIIVMVTNYSIHPDRVHSVYGTLSGGQVYVFQNGGVTTGTWAKPGDTAQITFSDDAGKPILLNPGQTWITPVSSSAKVSYTP